MSADLSDRYSRLRRSRVLPAPLSLSLSHARLSERRQKRSLSSLIGGRQLIFKFISFHGKQRAFFSTAARAKHLAISKSTEVDSFCLLMKYMNNFGTINFERPESN